MNNFEQEESLRQVAQVFKTLERDYIRRIDGSQEIGLIHAQIVALVRACLAALCP